MRDKILSAIEKDTKITQYEGESIDFYYCRLIYSALVHWIRFLILDETNNEEDEQQKSKKYINSRGNEILHNFLKVYPECKSYFDKCKKNIKAVAFLREKMLDCGELMEFYSEYSETKNRLGLPIQYEVPISKFYSRIISLAEPESQFIFTGLTRIVKRNNINYKSEISSATDFLKLTVTNAKWEEIGQFHDLEFFNPLVKCIPSEAWNDSMCNKIDLTLGRCKVVSGNEYYLVKKENEKSYIYKLQTISVKYKNIAEYRRLILALRSKFKNPINAVIEKKSNVVLLHLYCGLPMKEEIIINTFAWPQKSIGDYKNYVIPMEIWENINQLLKNLCIKVEE